MDSKSTAPPPPAAATIAKAPPSSDVMVMVIVGDDGGDCKEVVVANEMAGELSTGMPSALEAVSAVARLLERSACTADAVVEAGTAIMAVMSTLAAVTLMVTNDASTLASCAIVCCRVEVSA